MEKRSRSRRKARAAVIERAIKTTKQVIDSCGEAGED